MLEQLLEIVLGPAVIVAFGSDHAGERIQFAQGLYQHQGMVTLVHGHALDHFGIVGVIGQGYDVTCQQEATIDSIDLLIELIGREALPIIDVGDDQFVSQLGLHEIGVGVYLTGLDVKLSI